jgi:uncharacterized membrane protein
VSAAVQNSEIECPKKVMQGADQAGILARGLFAWLFSKAHRPFNYEPCCVVFIRQVSIDQRHGIAVAIGSGFIWQKDLTYKFSKNNNL